VSDIEIPNGSPSPDYVASGHGRRLKLWRSSTSGPNAVLASVETVRARSRAATRNDPWGAAASDRSVSNGIGTGVQAKMVNGSPELRAAVHEAWEEWVGQCDADGVLDFYGLQAVAWREWEEAGEVFARIRSRRPEDGLRVPMQLQLIEAEQCPTNHNAYASNGNPIRQGIEFDRLGRRVAYWMYREHPGDQQKEVNGTELVRVPADQVMHLYTPLRAGQHRGMPHGTSALVQMYNLDRFSDAVLDRQQIANLFSVFFVRDKDTQGPGIGGDLAKEKDKDDVDIGGLEPGTAIDLPAGVKTEFASPPDAGGNYVEYLRSHLQAIAAARGIPYEVLTGDLRDVSDRALRLILNEFRRNIEQRQWLYLIPQMLQKVRMAFMDAAVLSGAIDLDDYAARRTWYSKTLWVPQGWPWSHPVQDVTAERNAVRAGFKSRSAAILGSGEDPEGVYQQIDDDNRRADESGFVFDSDPRKTSANGITQAVGTSDASLPDTSPNEATQ
jgi:lambda family phage portal protein